MVSMKIKHLCLTQRIRLDPFPVLPITAPLGDLAQVDLRIEIGRKGLAVVAPVAINDVNVVNLVEMVLLRPGLARPAPLSVAPLGGARRPLPRPAGRGN